MRTSLSILTRYRYAVRASHSGTTMETLILCRGVGVQLHMLGFVLSVDSCFVKQRYDDTMDGSRQEIEYWRAAWRVDQLEVFDFVDCLYECL